LLTPPILADLDDLSTLYVQLVRTGCTYVGSVSFRLGEERDDHICPAGARRLARGAVDDPASAPDLSPIRRS
jgi:hypothetical protein